MIEKLEPNEMGVTEARKLLGVTPQTIRNWAREGRFPILRGGGDMDTPIILDRALVLDYARLRGKLDESELGDAPAPEPEEKKCSIAADHDAWADDGWNFCANCGEKLEAKP